MVGCQKVRQRHQIWTQGDPQQRLVSQQRRHMDGLLFSGSNVLGQFSHACTGQIGPRRRGLHVDVSVRRYHSRGSHLAQRGSNSGATMVACGCHKCYHCKKPPVWYVQLLEPLCILTGSTCAVRVPHASPDSSSTFLHPLAPAHRCRMKRRGAASQPLAEDFCSPTVYVRKSAIYADNPDTPPP